MEPLDNIYHSTQVEVAAAIENDDEVELATAVQRIVAWIINRVIEVVLMIPAFGLIIALVLKSSGGTSDFENMETMFASLLGWAGLGHGFIPDLWWHTAVFHVQIRPIQSRAKS